MKIILLAGGLGTRISEETADKPKPMVLIGNQPILWHLMNIFAKQGFKDFLIATGYKGEVIHDWVAELKSDWQVEALDTGLETQTGGRIKRCIEYLDQSRVIATYGDGLGNVNVNSLIEFHDQRNFLATLTAVRPPARFGVVQTENGVVTHFGEKNQADAGWINGGFFVLEREVANYISGDDEPFETGALPRMVSKKQLGSFHHHGFWQPMDTLREKHDLEKMTSLGVPPWLK